MQRVVLPVITRV